MDACVEQAACAEGDSAARGRTTVDTVRADQRTDAGARDAAAGAVRRRVPRAISVGLDIGSTTTKVVVLDAVTHDVLYWRYKRHGARQAASAAEALEEVRRRFPGVPARVAVTGSGARDIARALGADYVQEVVANAIAICELYPQVRCAVELGGQDAKMLFFHAEGPDAEPQVSDMRMNGSCAGGTGAFIDEMAKLLGVSPEGFEELAAAGTRVYEVSGRCGVYAKTDIQPLLNQGVSRADLALSALHAVARQTIGGLAQGIDIEAPVIFEGGTLAYHPTLVRVFTEQLELAPGEAVVPADPQVIIARGAALSLDRLFAEHAGEGADGAGRAADGADGARPDGTGDRAEGAQSAPVASTASPGGAPEQPAAHADAIDLAAGIAVLRDLAEHPVDDGSPAVQPFFASEEERTDFVRRHPAEVPAPGPAAFERGDTVHAILGIDSGSTTTKFALIDAAGELLDSFYASNEGKPLDVARAGLMDLKRRWDEAGVALVIDAVGTTGYGEQLFARAFHADYHTVETVAHARAAAMCVPDATFVLDIGGQDMKAIWLDHGVLTDIVVNEACSAGCGSFLEGFAANLGVAVEDIASAAFRSTDPAALGSRCTVFMNSSVVSEQRRGKGPDDIMAGLCRSIIENVFTKVIRVANLDALGERIVVQGGTFRNDAVLRAFEQFLGRSVTRAPHPGLMGAIGVALLAQEHAEESEERRGAEGASSFIGLNALEGFAHTEHAGVTCRRCGNRCARSVVAFSDGALYVTGNRCPRGEEISWMELIREVPEAAADAPAGALAGEGAGAPTSGAGASAAAASGSVASAGEAHPAANSRPVALTRSASARADGASAAPTGPAVEERRPEPAANLFDERERLLFKNWPCEPVAPARGETVGIPRVLEFWDQMPFWSTLFRSLGFAVRISRPSTRRTFERGLAHVTSDTVCFPAKLVHGHIRDLADVHVDRIFMPIITTVPTENTAKTSEWMCAVVKGYPYVLKNSDDPERRFGIPFDAPLFHWYTVRDRDRQLGAYLSETYGVTAEQAARAIRQADEAQCSFAGALARRGEEVLAEVRRRGGYAVVIASRPYHNDPLVNHGVPKLFSSQGIAVLTPDALPGVREQDLSRSRLDIVNNFHARMLSAALITAATPELEYVQLVSFGCGHDAYLSDEISRMLRETSSKAPLILKIDESDATGPAQDPRALVYRDHRASAPRRGRPPRSGSRPAPAARPLRGQVHARDAPDQGGARAQHEPCVLPAHDGGAPSRGRADRPPARGARGGHPPRQALRAQRHLLPRADHNRRVARGAHERALQSRRGGHHHGQVHRRLPPHALPAALAQGAR